MDLHGNWPRIIHEGRGADHEARGNRAKLTNRPHKPDAGPGTCFCKSQIEETGALVAGGGASGLGPRRTSLVLGAGARESLLDSRFDIAFRLPANGGQLRNDEVVGTFQHALFAERERLEMAQVSQMLEDVSDFEDIAGPHLI